MNNRRITAFFLIWGITSAPVFAQEIEQPAAMHQSIVDLIKQMTQNGMLTKESADQLLLESEQSAPAKVAVPSGVTTKDVSAPSGVAAKDIAAPSEIDTKKVAAPSAVVTKDASAPSGVAAKDIAAPSEIDTKKVAAPSAVVTKDVSAPSGIAAKEVSAPSGVDTKKVATPSAVVSKDVSAPSGVAAKDVAAPSGVDAKKVAAPSAVVSKDVSAPSGIAAKEVSAPSEIVTKKVAAPSAVVAKDVAAPSGDATMKVAALDEFDTQEVAAPSGVVTKDVSTPSGVAAKKVAAPIASAPAIAQEEKKQLEILHQSITNLIKMLTQKGVMSQDAADQLIHDAEQSAAKTVVAQNGVATTDVAPPQNVAPAQEPVKPGVVRVPYVPEVVRREIKEEIRQEVLAQAKGERWGDPGALPDWVNRISWDGDFRLRYESDTFPAGNALPGAQAYIPTVIGDTTVAHNYMLVQARLNMKAVISDNTIADFRFTSGTTTNPDSSNQTLGTGFNKSNLLLDRAYVQSTPYNWLTLIGGKIPNPWLSTDLVWDSDVNFEGVVSQFKLKTNDQWSEFLTVGAFPYQNILKSDTVLANSKWLYGAQLSAQRTAFDSSTAQFGVALYNFRDAEGIPNPAGSFTNPYSNTAVESMQKGNSLVLVNTNDPNNPGNPATLAEVLNPANYGLASKFEELNLTAKMDWAAFDPVHVMLTGDYVRNLGFNAAEIAARTGLVIVPEITGYQAILAVGSPRVKRRGDWQASFAYKYIQRDAVLDALNDQDFHLGGTNAKGYVVRASYGLDKETSVGLVWLSTDQIDGPPLSIDTLQVEMNVKF